MRQYKNTTHPSPILSACKQKLAQGNQIISRALDLDEEINADSRIDIARQVEKAKAVVKLYLDGGEVLKAILTVEINKLSRYNSRKKLHKYLRSLTSFYNC